MRARLKLPVFLAILAFFLLICVFPLIINSHANQAYKRVNVPYTQKEFINKISKEVIPYAKVYGIRSSIIIGQILLESQNGQTLLASRYHNLFGMEARPGQAFVNLYVSKTVASQSKDSFVRFTRYPDWQNSIADYLSTLRQGQVWDKHLYRELATQEGYKAPAQALEDYIYSYDKDYSNKLIKVIEDNDLTQFDQ
ncbi:glycoside hydrolase family 73 protein [Streptococcus pseudoporcinus]|uniref:N-acetyl-muramidase n=1 Tax=Streptococcus pseudoporcinus TaxID=361101 RepID=A0A4U9Y722_9STRE|nr:glucosaminidase domain-containing protein [Streptococcus pseudoporcinus]VTS21919.1 N-acetyl-muramidase [Streptococcus pseudoporcinus]VUC70123.1 N-acetyl-muramidase [Streptococcus pseudoporcinus]VUD00193.1 N-acetyl-muramidase [Streptococcus pseudoporcinus]VUD00585.1 N-acetyl-muramidase [Streptococcus pseudoporcinus]